MSKKTLFHYAAPAIITGMLFATAAISWDEPGSNPPTGNVAAPINVSADGQYKEGKLNIGNTQIPDATFAELEVQGGGAFRTVGGAILNTGGVVNSIGLIVDNGKVGIGAAIPNAKLGIDMEGSAAEGLHISRTAFGANSYLNIEDEGNNPIFKVHENGSVGIRIANPNPETFLHILGAAPECEVLIESPTSAAYGIISNGSPKRIVNLNNISGNQFWIEDSDFNEDGTLDDRYKIISSKKVGAGYNVGIGGVDNPSQKLEVKGGIRLNTTAGRPACNANARGTFWFTQNAVKDVLEICANNTAAGGFAWRQIY